MKVRANSENASLLLVDCKQTIQVLENDFVHVFDPFKRWLAKLVAGSSYFTDKSCSQIEMLMCSVCKTDTKFYQVEFKYYRAGLFTSRCFYAV